MNKIIAKQKLSIHNEFVLLTIGQFIPRKGFDLLLKSIIGLDGIKVFIVGGEPTEEYLRIINDNNLTHVSFMPYMDKEELDLYFKASDVFVLPTREDIWGLVVNEALSYGLPVITTNRCIAGLELIKDEFVGLIVPTDNITALRKCIMTLKESFPSGLFEAAFKRLSFMRDFTVEKMAKVHIDVLKN